MIFSLFFSQSSGASRGWVFYQRGLPRLVFLEGRGQRVEACRCRVCYQQGFYRLAFDTFTFLHSKFVYVHALVQFNNLPDVPGFISFWFSIWFSKSLGNNRVGILGL